MKNIVKRVVLLGSLILMGSIHAQSHGSFSETILGTWKGTGTLFNKEASFSMKWENELNSKFMALSFENKFTDDSGVERIMNAKAFYNLKQNKGVWFDSRGMMLPSDLQVSDESMTVLWGDEKSERGKTIYSLIDAQHLSVEDFVFKEDSYLPFGKANYIRE